MNTIFPSSSETGMESLPSTRQPWITFFYCTEFLTYENLIKGEETESLRYIWVGLNMTIQLHSSTKLKEKSVPPFVKWEITPASTVPEEPNSPLVIMPETPSTIHLAMMKPSLSTNTFPLSTGYNACYPGGETCKERFLRNICPSLLQIRSPRPHTLYFHFQVSRC